MAQKGTSNKSNETRVIGDLSQDATGSGDTKDVTSLGATTAATATAATAATAQPNSNLTRWYQDMSFSTPYPTQASAADADFISNGAPTGSTGAGESRPPGPSATSSSSSDFGFNAVPGRHSISSPTSVSEQCDLLSLLESFLIAGVFF